MRTAVGPVTLCWDAQSRLLEVVQRPGDYDDTLAHELQAHLSRWLGTGGGPLRILVDLRGVEELGPPWRSAWLAWFARTSPPVHVAVFGVDLLDPKTLPVFALTAGIDLRIFPDEPSARAWLDETKAR